MIEWLSKKAKIFAYAYLYMERLDEYFAGRKAFIKIITGIREKC